jgi:hypothetical protein
VFVLKPWIVNEWIPKRQKIFAVVSNVIALLGLTALALILTLPATSLPVGWIVFVVAVIQITLSYSPKRDSAVHRAAARSKEYRHTQHRANGSYDC